MNKKNVNKLFNEIFKDIDIQFEDEKLKDEILLKNINLYDEDLKYVDFLLKKIEDYKFHNYGINDHLIEDVVNRGLERINRKIYKNNIKCECGSEIEVVFLVSDNSSERNFNYNDELYYLDEIAYQYKKIIIYCGFCNHRLYINHIYNSNVHILEINTKRRNMILNGIK